jgi:hypothetical protein
MPASSRLLVIAALLFGAACAGRTRKAATPDVVTPPIPLGSDRPALVVAATDTIYSVFLDVDVAPDGRADLSTLRLSGSLAETNRVRLESWLRRARFQPATRNGVAVRGHFRMTADALMTVNDDTP